VARRERARRLAAIQERARLRRSRFCCGWEIVICFDGDEQKREAGKWKLLVARLGDEADVFDSGEADGVQGDFHVEVAGSGVGHDVNAIFRAGAKSLLNHLGELVEGGLPVAEEHLSVASYSDAHGVFAARAGEPRRMLALGQVNTYPGALMEEECGRHYCDEQYEEDGEQCRHVDLADVGRAPPEDSFFVASPRRPRLIRVTARDTCNGA